MILSVDFISRLEAEVSNFDMRHAVISITDPQQVLASIAAPAKLLRTQFKDITEPQQIGAFSISQAQEIASFIDNIHADRWDYRVVVHCQAGVCRSAAVALFIEAYTGCKFPNRSKSAYANHWVLNTLANTRNLEIEIPLPTTSPGGIYLF